MAFALVENEKGMFIIPETWIVLEDETEDWDRFEVISIRKGFSKYNN